MYIYMAKQAPYPSLKLKRTIFCWVYFRIQWPTSCKALPLHTASSRKQIWTNTVTVLPQIYNHPGHTYMINSLMKAPTMVIHASLPVALSIPAMNTKIPKASAMHKLRCTNRWFAVCCALCNINKILPPQIVK